MYQVPFKAGKYRAPNAAIPGNESSNTPVEIDFVPAGGEDLARLKSITYATLAVGGPLTDWSPDMQEATIRAFRTGGAMFVNTVTGIRNLTIPALMAKHIGLLPDLPTKADPANPTARIPDPDAPFQVTTGLQFSAVASYMPALAFGLAVEIQQLSLIVNGVDSRFFGQPSGSGAAATPGATDSAVRSARKRRGARGTAAGTSTAPSSPQPGT